MLLLAFKVIVATVLFIIAYNIWLILTSYRIVKFSWNFSGRFYPLVPFIGNVYVCALMKGKVSLISLLLNYEKYMSLPTNIWYNYKYHYLCNNAEEARRVLNNPKSYDKAQIYNNFKYSFGNSLLLVPAETWKPRRRYLRAAFKSNMLNSFIPTFYAQSCSLVQKIKSKGPEENLFRFCNINTFLNFLLTSTGLQEHEIDADTERILTIIDSLHQECSKLLINPLMPFYIWIRTPQGVKNRKDFEDLRQMLKGICLEGRKRRAEITEHNDDRLEVSLLDLLLSDDYENSGGSDVLEEFFLFASAATDTTGNALAFCFTLLGMHQDIQQRVFEEVISIVGDRVIESADIPKLIYTEAVISETLRIFPTVPVIGRYCNEDIDIGTNIIPKGANVLISIYHIHRNPAYWKDPLKFDPSRFFPENVSNIVPGAYLPFSSGPRNCIGQGVALIQLKITVANVIRHYKITSGHKSIEEFLLQSGITMKTENHLDCHFTPRLKKNI